MTSPGQGVTTDDPPEALPATLPSPDADTRRASPETTLARLVEPAPTMRAAVVIAPPDEMIAMTSSRAIGLRAPARLPRMTRDEMRGKSPEDRNPTLLLAPVDAM